MNCRDARIVERLALIVHQLAIDAGGKALGTLRHQRQRSGLPRHARHIKGERDCRWRSLPHAEHFSARIVAAAEHAIVFTRKTIGCGQTAQLGVGHG